MAMITSRGLFGAVVLTALLACIAGAAEVADNDLLYLEKGKQAALELKALRRAPITFSRGRAGVIAYLAKGQPVTVLALGESEDYVSAHTATAVVKGWVDASALEAPPAELLKVLRQRHEQVASHQELIETHQVTTGMTADEVQASLGKPDHRSIIRLPDKDQVQEQWEYIKYRYLPVNHNESDEKGGMRQVVSYERVPAGRKIVVFQTGTVVSVAEEDEPVLGSQGTDTSPVQPGAVK